CQSSGTAGVEMRSTTLFCARAARASTPAPASAAPVASRRRRETEVVMAFLLSFSMKRSWILDAAPVGAAHGDLRELGRRRPMRDVARQRGAVRKQLQ